MKQEKRRNWGWIRAGAAWFAVLLCFGSTLATELPEELNYRVSYQGVFSAGAKVPIADLVLRTDRPAPDAPYLESELLVSSAPYAAVETFYPIRYRIRSWYWPDRSAVLASEYHEFGRADDVEHKLIYLDRTDQPFLSRNLLKEDQGVLQALLGGSYRAKAQPGQRHAYDRLGLLQAIRARHLAPGSEFTRIVSNGRKMLRYRVKVEKAQLLALGGQSRHALKLRIDGLEQDERGREKPAHRPVYLWLSADSRQVPLLAVARGAAGKFYIERVTDAGLQLARREAP